jgi:cytochrome c oxidase subunit 2
MKFIFSDAPRDYQLFFQDTATPMMSGIIDLHQHIFFFIIIIFVFVVTQTINIIIFFKVSTFQTKLRKVFKVKK